MALLETGAHITDFRPRIHEAVDNTSGAEDRRRLLGPADRSVEGAVLSMAGATGYQLQRRRFLHRTDLPCGCDSGRWLSGGTVQTIREANYRWVRRRNPRTFRTVPEADAYV